MQSEPAKINWLMLALIGGSVFMAARGCQPGKPVDPVPPVPPGPVEPVEPVAPKPPTEAEVWESLAVYIESGQLGILNSHTDHVILIVEELKSLGKLTDISRIDPWRGHRAAIGTDNRTQIALILRGRDE